MQSRVWDPFIRDHKNSSLCFSSLSILTQPLFPEWWTFLLSLRVDHCSREIDHIYLRVSCIPWASTISSQGFKYSRLGGEALKELEFLNRIREKESSGKTCLLTFLLEDLREGGIWFMRFQYNWLIQSTGRTKALTDLEACCRDPHWIIQWVSTSSTKASVLE